MIGQRIFQRYIGIDYSGADERPRRLRELAVCCAVGNKGPEVVPFDVPGPSNWKRAEIAQWLVDRLRERHIPTLVGIDHAFSFPIDYFDHYNLRERDWDRFLEDFALYWSIDEAHPTVARRQLEQQILIQNGQPAGHRLGDRNWFRLTDRFARASNSVFDFEAYAGGVAHSTHAGLPWLLFIRRQLGARPECSQLLAF